MIIPNTTLQALALRSFRNLIPTLCALGYAGVFGLSANATESPYGGTAAAVPGIVSFCNYDDGGEGVGYHDSDSVNQGGVYRTDGVDITTGNDPFGNGYNVGWISAGEWMNYTINALAGTYTVSFQVAGYGGSFHLQNAAGQNISGAINIPNTGGYGTWQTVQATVTLPAGVQTITEYTDNSSGGFNLSTMIFPPTNTVVPGTIDFCNYNTGGEGVGYHDSDSVNQGGVYRTDGVDITTGNDPFGNGYNVGWISAGEWMKYTITATAGTYNVSFRVAGYGGSFHLENASGQNISGAINIPNTGGYGTWQTVQAAVTLSAGSQTIMEYTDDSSGGFNLSCMVFPSPSGSNPNLIVNDGFDDGTRTAGTNPLAVSWYSISGPGTDLAVVNDNVTGGINSGNALKVTPTVASEGIVAQMPVAETLMNGQSISLSFQYRFTGTTNANQAGLLRFGLLDSRGTPTAPPSGTGDNDAIDRVDDSGYYAATNPGLTSTTGTTLYKWGNAPTSGGMTYSPTLTGSSALQTTTTGASVFGGTTAHSATLTITRSGTALAYSATIDGQTAAAGTETNPVTYTFDSIAIATGASSVPSPFLVDNVQVQYSAAQSHVDQRIGVYVDSGAAGFDSTWTSNYNSYLSALGLTTAYFTPNFCDGSPLHGTYGSMTSAAQYEAGTQWGNAESQSLIPIASVPLANQASAGNETATKADLVAIAAGTYDSDYNLVFAAYQSGRWPLIYLRIGWEMNDPGSNYPWYCCEDSTVAADYVAAWKHVANLAHAYAAANGTTIKTVWCPAVCNYCPVSVTSTYPTDAGYTPGGTGDQYVDVVGIDVYTPAYLSNDGDGKYWDFGTGTEDASAATVLGGPGGSINRAHWLDFPGSDEWSPNSSGGGGVSQAIAMAEAHFKPFCVPETGSNNDNTDNGPKDDPILPLYLADRVSDTIARGTPVVFVSPWNGSGFIFTDGSRPNELASWKQFIQTMDALSP